MRLRRWIVLAATGIALLVCGAAAPPQSREIALPAPPDLAHIWELGDLYPSEEAWRQSKQSVLARVPRLTEYQGRLAESAQVLQETLDLVFGIRRDLSRLFVYANLKGDEDTRVPANLELRQEISLVGTKVAEASSFIQPEIIAVGAERIESFIAAEPGLEPYAFTLRDILRQREHTLGQEAEQVLSLSGLVAQAPSSVYGILANADISWPTVELSDGREVRLDQAGYTRYRSLPNREDRERVFQAFWSTFQSFQRTFGVTLFSQTKADIFYAEARKHPSALTAALYDSNVPEEVYRTLLEETDASLDTLHRYFRIRERLLGVEQLRYIDIYPPLVELEKDFSLEQAKRIVTEALEPLGEAYVSQLQEGLSARWMHVYPQPGKRSGAYMSGAAYDVHPYLLLNYNDDYESVSTLAHEWGHAMHSLLANANQPYPKASYSIFTAEIASVVNELLLLERMLAEATDDQERLYYLGTALENMRGTFYRQAMFAEFELAIHEAVEQGDSLSGEKLNGIYLDLLRRHHGHDQGVLRVDELFAVEWAYIPHFYRSFYVFQYATSMAAGAALVERILAEEPGAVETYLELLKAGGSGYPYELVRRAGVDLATPAPYRSLVSRMNGIMDQIETILDRSPAL